MTSGQRIVISSRTLLVSITGLAGVVGLSMVAFVYFDMKVDEILTARQSAIVDSEIRLLELIDRDEGRAALIRTIARRTAFSNDDFAIQALVAKDGRYLAGDVDWPQAVVPNGSWQAISTFARKGIEVSGYGRAVTLSDGARVLVGRDRTAQRKVDATLVRSMLIVVAVLFAGTVGLGVYLNRQILKRISEISNSAKSIIAGDLAERFPHRQESEFDQLGGVLNELLDRNASHLREMRLVTDVIAHELRHPMQRIRARIDQAMTAKDASSQAAALVDATAAMDGAMAMFDGLLDVARAEAGIGRESFGDVDLEALVRDLAEVFGPLAEDKEQTFSVAAQPVRIVGHKILLRQAAGNLIHNAIKFTPKGGTVSVELDADGQHARIAVRDNGSGISEDQKVLALRPFGRLDRDAGADGSGLGLALVAACVKLHKGTLTLESAHPGLRVVMELPFRS